jgi:hypothetical protein
LPVDAEKAAGGGCESVPHQPTHYFDANEDYTISSTSSLCDPCCFSGSLFDYNYVTFFVYFQR